MHSHQIIHATSAMVQPTQPIRATQTIEVKRWPCSTVSSSTDCTANIAQAQLSRTSIWPTKRTGQTSRLNTTQSRQQCHRMMTKRTSPTKHAIAPHRMDDSENPSPTQANLPIVVLPPTTSTACIQMRLLRDSSIIHPEPTSTKPLRPTQAKHRRIG